MWVAYKSHKRILQISEKYACKNETFQCYDYKEVDLLNNHNHHNNVKDDEKQLCTLMSHKGKSIGKKYNIKENKESS